MKPMTNKEKRENRIKKIASTHAMSLLSSLLTGLVDTTCMIKFSQAEDITSAILVLPEEMQNEWREKYKEIYPHFENALYEVLAPVPLFVE